VFIDDARIEVPIVFDAVILAHELAILRRCLSTTRHAARRRATL
jgi:hypothetical protein